MTYYRIKIDELNNGEMYYIPQICELEVTRSWIHKQRLVWYNLINNHGDIYILSEEDTNSSKHITEERAMQVINDHRNYVNKKHGQQIKQITYKTIE